jgi:hypothetical protein
MNHRNFLSTAADTLALLTLGRRQPFTHKTQVFYPRRQI